MIGLWAYHWRMGRAVERLFRMAYFDRMLGPEAMRQQRLELKFCAMVQWSTDELLTLRKRA